MARYYIDTCIWRDYFENRVDRFRPLGEWAHRMLNQSLENKDTILCSEMVKLELEEYFKEEDIKRIFEPYSNIIAEIEIDPDIMSIARGLRKELSHGDSIHAAVAIAHSAVLVTRDRHFETVGIVVKRPEELL